jgi:hypothetical protein
MAERREQLDHLYEFSLVLLGILSAAEFQYYLEVEQEELFGYSLWVFTAPFIILILIWLTKVMFSDVSGNNFSKILTDFCWSFWGVALLYYLLNLRAGQYLVYYLLGLSIILILSITNAYDRAYAREEDISLRDYFRRHYWIVVVRWPVFFGAYLLLLLTVLPH